MLRISFLLMITILGTQMSAEVTSNDGIYIDGKPFFPLFAWAVPKKRIAFNKKMGLNTIVPGEKPENEGGRIALLDELAKNNMYCMMDAGDYDEKFVKHKALLMWKFGDEPDMKNIMPDQVKKEYDELKSKDKSHPAWINLTPRFFDHYHKSYLAKKQCPDRNTYKKYADACEAISFDHYPITGWNKPDRIAELYHSTVDFCKLYPNRTAFVIIESADQDLKWTPKETRGPTPEETKAMAWMAIIGGAKGIGYFHVAFNPFRWDNLTRDMKKELPKINLQIRVLANAIVAGKQIEASTDNENIVVKAVTYNDKTYVMTVNLTREDQECEITVDTKAQSATVIDEKRMINLPKGKWVDRFKPLEVHLYRML